MNPYFPTSFNFGDTQTVGYGFSQMMPASQYRQAPQPMNSIESMYTTVQPYYSKDFLLTTFGNKPDYIKMFLTLSHEDKLKMYLLMEQKKIYGEITDKEAYQKILREIAQKLQNYNTFHQIKEPVVQNTEEKKKKELDSKIDLFCETSFQKLNVTKIGEKKNEQESSKKYKDIDQFEDSDEWVQSTSEEATQMSLKNNTHAAENDEYQLLAVQESNKENVASPTYGTPPAPVIFNMFNFDSDMERAMTKEIGLKDAQKLSIWELQLSETEVKNNEPNLREVFKKKDSVVEIKAQTQPTPIVPQASFSKDSFDIFGQYSANQAQQLSEWSNNFKTPLAQSEIIFGEQETSSSLNGPQLNFDTGSFSFDMITPSQAYEPNIEVPSQVKDEKVDDNEDEEWNDGHEENDPQQLTSLPAASYNIQTQPKQDQSLLLQQQYAFISKQQAHPSMNFAVQPIRPNENLFDFDILDSQVQPQAIISETICQDTADLFLSARGNPKNEKIDVQPSHDDYHIIVPEIPQEIIQTVVDLQVEPNMLLNTQLYLPDNERKYEIIDHLKIEFSEIERTLIKKELKNKSFECNTEFYLIILSHLRQANLQATSEYEHFTQQYKIVKEMHQLTDKYTAVVDEEDEEKVERALRQSKALYNKIYNKSTISQKYVEHLLSEKNKQKGMLYKFGKILIDSCINTELISRVSTQQNRENVFNSFCLLFILEKNNCLNKLKNYSELIIAFTNQEIERYKSYNDQLFREVQEKMADSSQILTYIKGLLKIVSLCERMIQLMKSCSIKSNANLVKTLKNCKQIKNRFNRYVADENHALYPQSFGKILKSCIQKNFSLYDLHAKFSQVAERSPVCQICLLEIDNSGDYQEQKGWHHYSCFNLMKSMEGTDYI